MADPLSLVGPILLAALSQGHGVVPADLPIAVRACVDATAIGGVDAARLTAAGRVAYDIETGDAGAPMRLYGRGSGPMLMAGVGAEAARAGCHVILPVAATAHFGPVADLLSGELHSQPTERKGNQAIWVMGDKGVMLEAAGNTTHPTVRITVVSIAEGTK